MERGDIYLVSLDPTSGHEQQGTYRQPPKGEAQDYVPLLELVRHASTPFHWRALTPRYVRR